MTFVQATPPRCEPAAVRPVRVCFLIDRLATAGTETQLVALLRRLNRSRVRPFLCLLDGSDELSRSLEPADCPVLRLGVRSLRRPTTAASAWVLARFLRRERIDVLQVYFPDSTFFGVPVGRLAGVPFIVRTRNYIGNGLTPTHHRIGRVLNRFVTATVANSEACRRAFIADEWAAPGSVLVLENGVDLDRFPGRGAIVPPGGRGGPWGVGAVSNLREVKGLDVFVRAASVLSGSHPGVTFRVAGEGPTRAGLEAQVADSGLVGRFELPGVVSDVPGFLAGVDVAVLCSWEEGMSNALLEYMAAGRAVVATAVGGNVDLIEDGIHGLLVPPGDPGALARAVGRLLDDPGLAARLGGAARDRVERHYSRGAMVRRFEDFYQGLVMGGGWRCTGR